MTFFFRFVWVALFTATIIQTMTAYPTLPESIAVHFNAQGQPDQFGSKQNFYIFLAIMSAFLNGMFLLFSIFIRKIPVAILNLPWKDYWFKNEERQKIAYGKLGAILAMTGGFFNGVFYLVNFAVIRSSTSPKPCPVGDFIQNNLMWFILGSAVILVALIFVIMKPKSPQET